jgi:hypothetical protein
MPRRGNRNTLLLGVLILLVCVAAYALSGSSGDAAGVALAPARTGSAATAPARTGSAATGAVRTEAAAGAGAATGAVRTEAAAPARPGTQLGKGCDGNAECLVNDAADGITLYADGCATLHLDKYMSGLAVFVDAALTRRLVPLASAGGSPPRLGVETRPSTAGPYFRFIRTSAANAFKVIVDDQFVGLAAGSLTELVLGTEPTPLAFAGDATLPYGALLLGAELVGGVLRRHASLRNVITLWFVKPGPADGNKPFVCVSADAEANVLYGRNGTALEHDADASKSDALYTCNSVGEWGTKPLACARLCELTFPLGDAAWCDWAARVDPVVASRAINAGVCCTNWEQVTRDADKRACKEVEHMLWVGVPFASGAFGTGADARLVRVPAYATIALRLSRLEIFSSACV